MREKILSLMREIHSGLELRRFYLPEPYRPPGYSKNPQPYDRLLIVLSGIKNEPMNLHGKLTRVPLEKGDFYLIRKTVWEYTALDTPHEFFCIVPHDGYLRLVWYPIRKPQRGHDPWPENVWLHTKSVSESLLHAFEILKSPEAAENPPAAAECAKLIVRLSILEAEKGELTENKARQTFERLRHFVEYNFTSPITREVVAEHFGLTPAYVSQLFRRYLKRSFIDYLSGCRFDLAKRMLLETDIPIKNLYAECGFENEIHFIRRFRELNGLSPGRFRIRHTSRNS